MGGRRVSGLIRHTYKVQLQLSSGMAVKSPINRIISGVILADPTFLSGQRQREVRDSDVAEQHRRVLSLEKREVLAQARLRHTLRSSEILELLAAARMQTRMSAFDVLTPPNLQSLATLEPTVSGP